MAKVIYVNAKTGKVEEKDEEVKIEAIKTKEEGVDLRDLKKLIEYAKKQGWI